MIKKDIAHINFTSTVSSILDCIQLHSRGQIFLFSKAENPRPPLPVWTTFCGVRLSSGENCLLNYCAFHKHANFEVQMPTDDCVVRCRQSS